MTDKHENTGLQSPVGQEILKLSQQLLTSIEKQDWAAYTELCDNSLTAFEPEAVGNLVEGMPFHKFYFELEGSEAKRQSTICSPHLRVMGDVAVITYIRLVQKAEPGGSPESSACEETRVWQQQQNDRWQHVHFHRSPVG
jgi:ketosteroid isomerase-like protein